MTTLALQMSVLKCRASTSRARLLYLTAARLRALERDTSTIIETSMTTKAHAEASTTTTRKNSRWIASWMIQTQVASSRAGLRQGREVLDLAVPVEVIGVGRLTRPAYREVRHQGGHQVQG